MKLRVLPSALTDLSGGGRVRGLASAGLPTESSQDNPRIEVTADFIARPERFELPTLRFEVWGLEPLQLIAATHDDRSWVPNTS